MQYVQNDGTAASDPYYLTIGDFNRDGNLDIISANNGNATVGVLLGTGSGTFGAATYYQVGSGAIFANVGDINGDDRVDITAVTANGLSRAAVGSDGDGFHFQRRLLWMRYAIRHRHLRRRWQLWDKHFIGFDLHSREGDNRSGSHAPTRLMAL